jgi:hypothetical protein
LHKINAFFGDLKKSIYFCNPITEPNCWLAVKQRKEEQNKIVQSNEKNIPTFSEKEKEQARFP